MTRGLLEEILETFVLWRKGVPSRVESVLPPERLLQMHPIIVDARGQGSTVPPAPRRYTASSTSVSLTHSCQAPR